MSKKVLISLFCKLKLSIFLFFILYRNICIKLLQLNSPESANISYLMQLELFFKTVYICTISKRFWMEQDHTQFSDTILCDDSTGCDEVDNYFAKEADTMIYFLYEYED